MSSTESYKTVAEIATKFQVSKKTVYRMCSLTADVPWPCSRIGNRIRFSAEHEAAISELIQAPGPAPVTVDTSQLRAAAKRVLKARQQGLAA